MSGINNPYWSDDLYGGGLYGGTALVPGTTIPGIGGGITVWFELWRATIDNRMVEDISHLLIGGNVNLNHDRTITTQAVFDLRDTSSVTPYVDFLAVFQNTVYDDTGVHDRDQIGLFTVRVPSGSRTIERRDGTYTGYDITSVLQRKVFADTYNVAAGTNYVDAVVTIIELAGIARHAIPATDKVAPGPLSFPIGMTYLAACNALLDAIAYYNLSATQDGQPTSRAGVAVQYVEPYRTLDDDSIYGPVVAQTTDTTLANIVIVVLDNPNAAPLTAIRRNDAADSPTSTAVLGDLPRVELRSDLADQGAVDALADRLLAEGRTFYQPATVRLKPDPRVLLPHQTIDCEFSGALGIYNGRWWVRTAQIGFMPDTAGPHVEMNRITDAITGAII